MFRQAAMRLALVRPQQVVVMQRRSMAAATAAQKRALNKKQLQGDDKAASAPKGDSGTAPTPPSSSGGGNNGMLLGAAAVALGAGGYYYFSSQQQQDKDIPATVEKEFAAAVKEAKKDQEKPEPVKQKEEETPPPVQEEEEKVTQEPEPEPEPVVLAAEEEETVEVEPAPAVGHRVTTIHVPPVSVPRVAAVVAAVSHPSGGNRVSMEPPKNNQEVAAVFTAEVAARELRESEEDAASETLQKAHRALRANLDESLLQDLETASPSDLKIRLVQLAAEMKERTKWEAVRLKEFLALKEKETADKYLELMQKERLEFEVMTARRLLEQEEALTRQANAALAEKEKGIQAVIQAATEAQEKEHELDLKSTQERLEKEIATKYEVEFKNRLADTKAGFVTELQNKASNMEALSEKLKEVQASLEASKTFESGSQHAHRVSAAAMAFASKAETNKGAAPELAALQVAAGKDGVIASALTVVPDAAKTGIPTLPELQTRFVSVSGKARQAAMVPQGWTGLEGQLMGQVFSTLKLEPSPDEAVVGDDADSVLVRAQRHVQLGELDRAVEQLDKLQGQAAFTVKDWKQAAKDRLSLENALKVIRMECAVLNEEYTG